MKLQPELSTELFEDDTDPSSGEIIAAKPTKNVDDFVFNATSRQRLVEEDHELDGDEDLEDDEDPQIGPMDKVIGQVRSVLNTIGSMSLVHRVKKARSKLKRRKDAMVEKLLSTKEEVRPSHGAAYRLSSKKQYNLRPTRLAKVLRNPMTIGAFGFALGMATEKVAQYTYHYATETMYEAQTRPNSSEQVSLSNLTCNNPEYASDWNTAKSVITLTESDSVIVVWIIDPSQPVTVVTREFGADVQDILVRPGEKFTLPDGKILEPTTSPVFVKIVDIE